MRSQKIRLKLSKEQEINIELGNVPIDLFTDVQILLQIQKHKKSYDFSTIENIKKITSDEQFARFMKILAKI